MPTYSKDTKVTVDRSRAEIERILQLRQAIKAKRRAMQNDCGNRQEP